MLFGGMVFIMRYGCVIWGYGLHYEVWLCYLEGMVFIMRYGCVIWKVWSSLWGMVVLFCDMVFIMRYGCVILGYGLHYEVWLCYLGVWSSL